MKMSTTAAPLLFAATVLTAGVLAATQANAADRMTDVGYINAARCEGYAEGLGQDTAAYHRLTEVEGGQREMLATFLAQSAHDEAVNSVRQGDYWRGQARIALQTRCAISGPATVARSVPVTVPVTGEPNSGR
jgi:hypothetical protein